MRAAFVLVALLLNACGAGQPSPVPIAQPIPTSSVVQSPLTENPCLIAGATYCWLNPQVTQATINNTICVSGWTKTVRPPSSYTSPLKVKQIAAQHLVDTNPAHYEEDHRVPLELGGAPSDPRNLSPEAYPDSYFKDSDENLYRVRVCSGGMTLRQAQAEFIVYWLRPYPGYYTP